MITRCNAKIDQHLEFVPFAFHQQLEYKYLNLTIWNVFNHPCFSCLSFYQQLD